MESGSRIVTKTLRVEGMSCPSCEMRIENTLEAMPGVTEVSAKYADGLVRLTYDSGQIDISKLVDAIQGLDYKVKENVNKTIDGKSPASTKLLGVAVIFVGLYLIYKVILVSTGFNILSIFNFIPEVNQNMGYGILFIVGLLTSLHCIAMCGGINLSQCVAYNANRGHDNSRLRSKLKPSILYNAGRVVSYTVIGGIVGAIGSVISLSGTLKGLVSILAGVFMVIMGLNMLNLFPALRKLTPRMPKIFGKKLHNGNKDKKSPFVVGLFNGLMPCGPLQTMQIYALGTGNALAGALSMFMFSLGTVPLMFGLGAVSTLLSDKFTKGMMKASAGLVMILGVVMMNRGFSLSGIDPLAFVTSAFGSGENLISANSENTAVVKDGVQYVTTVFTGTNYAPITVYKGIPVVWTIQIEERDINGCNSPMQIHKYGIEIKFTPGENIIKFTPDETGVIPYSCWMGMINGRITVVDYQSGDLPVETTPTQVITTTGTTSSTSCCDNSGMHTAMGSFAANTKTGKYAPFITNDDITSNDLNIAVVTDNIQELTVTVYGDSFNRGICILQKGIDFTITFEPGDGFDETDENSGYIYFPEYQGGLYLSENRETPVLSAVGDFCFQDIAGVKYAFVIVVDDINNIDMEIVKARTADYSSLLYGAGGNNGRSNCH